MVAASIGQYGSWQLALLQKSCDAVRDSTNESAASAASLDYVKFQAVIKSAASAASRKPKSREGSSKGVPRGRCPPAKPPSWTPLELPSLDFAFGEAALAADLITAFGDAHEDLLQCHFDLTTSCSHLLDMFGQAALFQVLDIAIS